MVIVLKVFKRIVTQILAFVTCISLCVCTVFADWYNDLAYNYTQSNLAQWAVHSLVSIGAGAAGFAAGTVYCPGFGSISGTALGEFGANLLNGGIDALMADLAKDSSFVSEDDFVSSFDSPIVSMSDTSFSVPLHFEDEMGIRSKFEKAVSDGYVLSYSISDYSISYVVGKYDRVSSGWSSTSYSWFGVAFYYVSPSFTVTDGDYTVSVPSPNCVYSYALNSFLVQKFCGDEWMPVLSVSSGKTGTVHLDSGFLYRVRMRCGFDDTQLKSDYPGTYYGYNRSFSFGLPTFTIKSSHPVIPSTTRLSSYTQNVYNYNQTDSSTKYYIGKVDNSNNVTNVYNVNIFDETTNEFRDPYTDKPYQVTDWTYDYAQRIYYLTLADDSLLYNGTPVKHLAISYANDAMYYIGLDDTFEVGEPYLDHVIFLDPFRYVIAEKKDDSGTGSDGHKHVFTSETTTPPSCTGTGVRTYTCQFCDYSYDEIIPAAGHQWEVTEVKDTVFNDNGDVTAAGYTLYTCAVCGETYKQWSNTGQPGPPTGNTGTGSGGGGSGGSSGSGTSFWDKLKDSVLGLLADLIDAVFGLITDVLSAVLGLVKDLLSFLFGFLSSTVIKGITDLFSAFGSLKLELPGPVTTVFAFFSGVILALPAEVKSLMIFGAGALFLIAIFKLVKA